MFNRPPVAFYRTQQIVGQEEHLESLRKAVFPGNKTCQVVCVQAVGGMGKTRLLEEVLHLAGHPDYIARGAIAPWQRKGVIVSDLIDMVDVRLHVCDRFVQKLRDSVRYAGIQTEFESYDRIVHKLRRVKAYGAELHTIRQLEEEALQAFVSDVRKIKHRLVWVIDTVEKICINTSEKLQQWDVLPEDALSHRTYYWLAKQIEQGGFSNVTFILAGRHSDDEGGAFFKDLNAAVTHYQANQKRSRLHKTDINLTGFTEELTLRFFQQLTDDWQHPQFEIPAGISASQVAAHFELIVRQNLYRTIWLFTAGVPLRLALYAQLILDSKDIPDLLRLPFEQAHHYLEDTNQDSVLSFSDQKLEQAQLEIEKKLVDLLFAQPGTIETKILKLLVRFPYGLSARQVLFLLDDKAEVDGSWLPNRREFQEMQQLLNRMSHFYLVKSRPTWFESDRADDNQAEWSEPRYGLQDEIYRYYARQIVADKSGRASEVAERKKQYLKLLYWVDYQYERQRARKRAYLEQDERELERGLRPFEPDTFAFRYLGDREIEERFENRELERAFELERMVYRLLIDLPKNLNSDYVDLADKKNYGNEEDVDYVMQSETLRILRDPSLWLFLDLGEFRSVVKQRGETNIDVLRRATEQEDVTRWLKRFVLRGKYRQAIAFAEQVEERIKNLPCGNPQEQNIWNSWNHTFAWGERQLWKAYAQVYAAQDTRQGLAMVQEVITRLEELERHTVEQVVLTPDGRKEYGFRASRKHLAHPAMTRLRRTISHGYNILGYGYITSGNVRGAVRAYGQALALIRGDKKTDAHRAVVLNNLSRALSAAGWANADIVCRDGLELRRKLADEVPLAYSYNTLALISDDWGQVNLALQLVAKAVAYFRRTDSRRGLGLALIQCGEVLRHLAGLAENQETAIAPPDQLFTAARTVLSEAYDIFADKAEPIRFVLATAELASVFGEHLRTPLILGEPQKSGKTYYREAMGYFERAIETAREFSLVEQQLDAAVNQARTHIYYGELRRGEILLNEIGEMIKGAQDSQGLSMQGYWINRDTGELPLIKERTDLWLFPLLSKIQFLRGEVALRRFREQADQYKHSYPGEEEADVKKRQRLVHEDPKCAIFLQKAAQRYSLGLGYAELLTPGGRMVTRSLENLYQRIRDFNDRELADFRFCVNGYLQGKNELRQLIKLPEFLEEFLGTLPAQASNGDG